MSKSADCYGCATMRHSCEHDGKPKIRVDNISPPIPVREFDWVAWFDGYEEDGPYGYGPTAEEAVKELQEQAKGWG